MFTYYFSIKLQFDHAVLHETIVNTIKNNGKGYVCVVDANVLTMAQKNEEYKDVINNALINTCDGSSIAWLAGLIHKKQFKAYNGPELFENYIELDYNQLLLGSTQDTIDKIKLKLQEKNISWQYLHSMPLPFLDVNNFDYKTIANTINDINPDIIWVSLGAPKQELFMKKILPYLNRGVLFGIGAAFNFYTGEIPLPSFQIGRLRFIWLSRLFAEPKKLIKRLIPYVLIIPRLIISELKTSRKPTPI